MKAWTVCSRCGNHYLPASHFEDTENLCPICYGDDIAAAELEDGETEFIGEREVRCPWCGKRVNYGANDRPHVDISEENCPHCSKRYKITPECHWTYDTERVPE